MFNTECLPCELVRSCSVWIPLIQLMVFAFFGTCAQTQDLIQYH